MTRAEFNSWLKDYYAAFPDTSAWVNSSPDSKRTLDFWAQALAGTELADAKEVTRRMAIGEEPAPLAYEREATARMVAVASKRVRAGRRSPQRLEERLPDYGGEKWSMAGMLKDAKDMRDRGLSVAQAMAELVKRIPEDQNPPRYKCLRCRDIGVVLVWANSTIHAVMKRAERVPLYRCAVRCDCESGKRWSESFLIYQQDQFCLFSGYDKLREVEQWCDVKRSMRIQSMPNYVKAFEPGNY